MATLAQLSQIESTRGQGALALLLQDDPFIAHLEKVSGWEEDATSYDYDVVDPEAELQNRALGGSYTKTASTPPSRIPDTLRFYGDAVAVDRSHLADAERGLRKLDKWLDKEITGKVKKWSRLFSVELWQGPGTGNRMKGLLGLLNGVDDLPGYTGYTGTLDATTYTAGADNLDLTNKDNWAPFYELMIEASSKVENPTGIHCNKELYGKAQLVAKAFNVQGETRDLFGVPVPTFNNIPLIKLRDGCITNDEPDGDAQEVATSLVISAFAPDEAGLVTNSGMSWKDFDYLESKVSGAFEWELRCNWKISAQHKVVRVMKLKAK